MTKPRHRPRGEGGVRKRGRFWYVNYRKGDGARVEIKTAAESRNEAVTLLRNMLGEVGSTLPGARISMRAAYQMVHDDYSVKGQRVEILEKRWKPLESAFGDLQADEVTTDLIWQYVNQRRLQRDIPISSGTIQRELAALRRMLRMAWQSRRLASVPYIPTVEIPNVRKGFFEWEEFVAVRSHLSAPLKVLVTLSYWTGWRQSELIGLEWSRVDLKTGALRLDPGTTKNREARVAYVAGEALAVLRDWRKETLKVERTKRRIVARVIHRNGKAVTSWVGAWKAACEKAGVADRTPHDFRRTAARLYVNSGVSEGTAQQALGHKTAAIFRRYNIVDERDLKRAAVQVGAPSVADRWQTGKTTGRSGR